MVAPDVEIDDGKGENHYQDSFILHGIAL
jgi:hypothetical protein